MVKSDRLQRDKSDRLFEDLRFSLVASIVLHSILFFVANHWLQTTSEQKLSQPIPIEYIEVPPDKTKIPPKTPTRATRDSVAGGQAKPDRPVSTAKSTSPSEPKTPASSSQDFSGSQPAEVLQAPNPRRIAPAPATTPKVSQPDQQEVTSNTVTESKLQPFQTEETLDTTTPTTESQPADVAPDTTALTDKLRQSAIGRRTTTTPTTESQPTNIAPDTTALTNKLRQSTLTRRITRPATPKPQPTDVAPDTTALTNKLRQSTLTRRITRPATPRDRALSFVIGRLG
ncbi:hypothetical protein NUACC21_60230 [Scytonema sp. NUACC21]